MNNLHESNISWEHNQNRAKQMRVHVLWGILNGINLDEGLL